MNICCVKFRVETPTLYNDTHEAVMGEGSMVEWHLSICNRFNVVIHYELWMYRLSLFFLFF